MWQTFPLNFSYETTVVRKDKTLFRTGNSSLDKKHAPEVKTLPRIENTSQNWNNCQNRAVKHFPRRPGYKALNLTKHSDRASPAWHTRDLLQPRISKRLCNFFLKNRVFQLIYPTSCFCQFAVNNLVTLGTLLTGSALARCLVLNLSSIKYTVQPEYNQCWSNVYVDLWTFWLNMIILLKICLSWLTSYYYYLLFNREEPPGGPVK